MSRTSNAVRNIKYAIIGQMLGILVSFVGRLAFVKILSVEYLGLSGLFTNILSILHLAELGVGTSINYSLYKPLANKDEKKISALMLIYKKAYTIIGTLIGLLGISLTPFLHYLVKDLPNIPNIRLIYILFVLNSALSYFFTYKRALIIADQKRYIATLYRYGLFIVLTIVQIIALYITRDFFMYLGLQLLFTLLENILISHKADKLYPFLKIYKREILSKEDKVQIKRNVMGMICHRIGGVVVNGTDNVLIAKLVGIVSVGLYSNYLLIYNSLNTVYGLLFQSLTASVGNLAATEDSEKSENVFNIISFAGFWIYGFSSICLLNLFNPFISIWLGKEFLFSISIVLVISINFYLYGMRKSVLTFHSAYGLYWFGKSKPLFEAFINLVASILLGSKFGSIGILIGTAMSTLTTCFWVEPYILYKYGFKKTVVPYFIKYAVYTIVFLGAGTTTYALCSVVNYNGLKDLIIKAVICLIVPNAIFLIAFSRTPYFKYIIRLLLNVIKNKFSGKDQKRLLVNNK